MGKSSIEWTDYTFNPWWGCKKISPACENCYAERTATRFEDKEIWGKDSGFKFQTDDYWTKPFSWNDRARQNDTQYLVFTGSMCDIFQDDKQLEKTRQRLFKRIRQTPNLWWLLLTKRPENIKKWADDIPFWNTWLGVTGENQKKADERLSKLLRYPAQKHFVSCEPLLCEVNLGICGMRSELIPELDWIIAGGESGDNARETKLEWYRQLREQCERAGTPFFMKQITANGQKVPFEEWPEDLKIRQFPGDKN